MSARGRSSLKYFYLRQSVGDKMGVSLRKAKRLWKLHEAKKMIRNRIDDLLKQKEVSEYSTGYTDGMISGLRTALYYLETEA